MKILYSANNFSGSNLFLNEFLEKTKNHDVKIMAYYKNSECLHHIDWTTDGFLSGNKLTQPQIKEIFQLNERLPCLKPAETFILYNEVLEWDPDLIISDIEPIAAFLAHSLNKELWYCSPFLLLTGTDRDFLNIGSFQSIIEKIKTLPKASRYLINSPFCDIKGRPFLLDGFEWLKTYSKTPINIEEKNRYSDLFSEDIEIITGETIYLAHCFYNNKYPLICFNDEEQKLNAVFAENYNVGFAIGNNVNILNSVLDRINPKADFLSKQNWPTLDELIEGK